MRSLPVAALVFALAAPVPGAAADLDALGRIRDEGLRSSEVMEIAEHLTDAIGPRLTGSPQMRVANEWTRDQFSEWGLADARLEPYEFGEGWSFTRSEMRMLAPVAAELFALPKAWTPGTDGVVRGEAMKVKLESAEDVEKLAGKISGKILFVAEPRERRDPEKPMFVRRTPAELDELVEYDIPGARDREAWRERRRKMREVWKKANELFAAEGVLATVDVSSFDHGAVRLGGAGTNGIPGELEGVPALVLGAEQYARIYRLLEEKTPVELEIQVDATYHRDDPNAWNTLAELPGGSLRDEIVMAGAHLDSWHPGTGATDNAAGSAVVMEAARILKSLGRTPRRTIRFALWSGEEQGLLGSSAYVEQHLATRPESTDPEQLELPARWRQKGWPIHPIQPAYGKFYAYFNLDNGGGRVRGIYAQENLGAKALFERWMAPLADLGVTAVTMENTSSTDHVPFDRVGLPGFQFVQDSRDYSTRTHHSHLDTYDYLQREDLMQAAVVMASTLWQAANEDGPFPRKPMPEEPKAEREKRERRERGEAEEAKGEASGASTASAAR